MTRVSYNWDAATVLVKVPTHFTATETVTEVELPLCQFADLIAGHLRIDDGELRGCVDFSPILSHEVPDS